MPTMTTPYSVSGILTKRNGSTILPNIQLKLTNGNTGDTLTTTTAGDGSFVFNLANLDSGYNNGQVITIEIDDSTYSEDDFDYYVSIDNNNSNRTWQLIEENVYYYPSARTIRFKVDLTNYPQGREANIYCSS